MESPVVVDKPPEYHGNTNERGFPFDEEEGSGAWSELAARHPDIAARLRQRPATWANKRRPSSQDATDDFGDNFSGFDRFPFDDIPPEFREHFPSHWNRRFAPRDEPQTQPAPERPQPQTQQQPQQQQSSPNQQTTSTQTEQDPGPSTQTHLPQYGLRNTVDLGQKSPADPSLVDADDRNQRSMSAPPDGCTPNQSHAPNMSAQNHQDQHQGHQPQHSDHQQSNVRHIPIFVEGRDEPVINKNVDHGTHYGESKPQYAPPPQPQQPQPHIEREQYFPDDGPVFHPPPNFSRAFGTPFNKGFRQGPQPFQQQKVYPQTAFTRGASPQRSQSPKPQMHPEEHFVKVPVHHEHAAPKPEPQPRPQPKQQPSPPQHSQPPQQAPPKQQTPPPQPKPQPSPNDPITLILSIQTDVLNLMTDVENFTGSKKDKRYLFLDEMLTRNLIKLDNIETDGKENIRQARKEAIKCIQKCIAVLEAKAEKGGSAPQPQDVEMNEGAAAATEEKATENGVEVEMKDAPKEEKVEEPQAAKREPAPQEETPKAAEPETKVAAAEPQAADTRPEETKPSETTPEEKKNEEVADKKATPKKGTKNVKKRDKSKDSKKETKDSNKEQSAEEQKSEAKAEGMQIDDKGDKTETQTMDVDGAASQ
ncbi:unnamed protein product [Chilo suppressalis]|uniref:BAG domain-containing protein n=1 Tax=Chilo suppressalis TaxID=168631 RepID=A0ABN8ATD1_CHISP|nr:unnamed protein product [Chilo suppressalis]